MADKKISELTNLTGLDSADFFPIVDVSANTTKRSSLSTLANFIVSLFPNNWLKNSMLSNTAGEIGGAWQSWIPTMGGSGSMTVSAVTVLSAKWTRIGTTVIARGRLQFTVGGTVSTEVNVSLPVPNVETLNTGVGGAFVVDSALVTGMIYSSATTVNIRKYDGSNFSAGTGRIVGFMIVYEAA